VYVLIEKEKVDMIVGEVVGWGGGGGGVGGGGVRISLAAV